jgi:hypothetical protein
MGPENDDSIDTNTSALARRCAQIKQRIRLSKCVHPEKSLIFMLDITGPSGLNIVQIVIK